MKPLGRETDVKFGFSLLIKYMIHYDQTIIIQPSSISTVVAFTQPTRQPVIDSKPSFTLYISTCKSSGYCYAEVDQLTNYSLRKIISLVNLYVRLLEHLVYKILS